MSAAAWAAPAMRLTILDVDPAGRWVGNDGDPFVDNCERVEVQVEVANIGTEPLFDVELTRVESSPGLVVDSDLPQTVAPLLAVGEVIQVHFRWTPAQLQFGDRPWLTVSAQSQSLSDVSAELLVEGVESDLRPLASTTFGFERDLESWRVEAGSFVRSSADGGAAGSAFYLASSAFVDGRCDHVVSPILRFGSTSTLALWTRFETGGEPGLSSGGANVGLLDIDTGVRTSVLPDGGRLYSAAGGPAACGLAAEQGWTGTADWAPSTWTAAALGNAGPLLRLDLRYGSSDSAAGFGLHFDQVTISDVELQVPDEQPDSCLAALIFAEGFESGDLGAWSLVHY